MSSSQVGAVAGVSGAVAGGASLLYTVGKDIYNRKLVSN